MTKENKNITVAVGLSGGVDSSVCAYLLKKQRFNVIGIFMKNWEDDEECPAKEDFEDVVQICGKLGIPYYTVNFAKEYWDGVFQEFINGLKQGLTPNPDILCNKLIKFDVLLKKAKAIGADFLATGHYAKISHLDGAPLLTKPKDTSKDQTYFLYTLNKEILQSVLFPLEDLEKTQIREIAKEAGLVTHDKKDSTGICFIGKRDFKSFIEKYIPNKEGDFVSLDGKKLGKHDGAYYYTIGQRKGVGIGGKGPAWFVTGKNIETNEVFLAQGEDHPALFSDTLVAVFPSWMHLSWNYPLPFACKAKIRYRQPEQDCIIEKIESDKVYVRFLNPQRAITPSQSIVFYHNDICLGGAVILESGPSLYKK